MQRLLCALVVAATMVGVARADDLKDMEGTWLVTIHEVSGKKLGDEQIKKSESTIIIKDGKYQNVFMGKTISEGTLKLDSTKKPKTMDALVAEGPGKGKSMLGVFELNGDSMTVCFAQVDKERPTGLKTDEGSGQVLLKYKREKK